MSALDTIRTLAVVVLRSDPTAVGVAMHGAPDGGRVAVFTQHGQPLGDFVTGDGTAPIHGTGAPNEEAIAALVAKLRTMAESRAARCEEWAKEERASFGQTEWARLNDQVATELRAALEGGR